MQQEPWKYCHLNRSTLLAAFSPNDVSPKSGVMGVYALYNPRLGQVIYVGSGIIADRLAEHQSDPRILRAANGDAIYVAWMAVPEFQARGVEAFLYVHYRPLVGERTPDVPQIQVQLPSRILGRLAASLLR